MKRHYQESLEEVDEVFVPYVMASFSCDKNLAQKIVQASRKNGQFESIKKMCEDQQRMNDK